MAGTRKRGINHEKEAASPASIGRAERAAKRKKAEDKERKEKDENRAKKLEEKKLEEEKKKQKEKAAERKRKKAKGKFVLEVDYEPSPSASKKLSEPSPSPNSGRLGLTPVWIASLHKLKDYKVIHGHCRVPIHWKEDPALGSWVKNQRRCFLQQKMPKERLEKLEEIGFEFVVEPEGITWERGVKDLKEYKEKNGDCDVPSGYDESPQLLKWIHYQRELYRKGLLSGARKAELENLNFEWEHSMPSAHAPKKSAQEIWDMQLEKLKSFKSENGHCNIFVHNNEDPRLVRWIETQRTTYRKGQMTEDRIQKLENLGFEWTRKNRVIPSQTQPTPEQAEMWQASFEKLKCFHEDNGHCDCPPQEYPALDKWVRAQRMVYKRNQMTQQRKESLESLSFDFEVEGTGTPRQKEETWNARLEQIKQYKDEHGHCNVPGTFAKDPVLGRWVGTQRTSYRRGQMRKDRVDALEALGFQWRIMDSSPGINAATNPHKTATGAHKTAADLTAIWQMQFEKLRVFKMANGHCNVPSGYAPDPAFSRWINTQRTVYRRNQIHDDRKAALESLGFEWRLGPRGRTWEESLTLLKEFRDQFGHCFVPANADDPTLRNWVIAQRQKHSKGVLPAEQINELELLGFAWSAEQEKHAMWEVRFEQLSQFSQNNGHCGVLEKFPEDPDLLEWISQQHTYFYTKKLSPERAERLISIGFVFNSDSVTADGEKRRSTGERVGWNTQYKNLLQFKETFGHTNVPWDYAEDPRLAKWVVNQRKLRSNRRGPTPERTEKLNALGFDWKEKASSGMLNLKSPPVAAADDTSMKIEDESETLMAAAEGLTAAARSPKRKVAPTAPTITWARGEASASPAQQGVQQMAVNLEVERAKLDSENKLLRRANAKLQTANQHLTKRLADAETKLQYCDQMLSTQAETLQNHGQQLQQLAQSDQHRPPQDQLREQASTLQTQGIQLTQLAQQVQDMRQVQYNLQHQVGVQQNLTYRL